MRLLAWNIRQGGGSRLPRIADALKRHDADIAVLSEYRGGLSAPRLCAALHALGYRYATTLVPPPSCNGVLVAARRPFRGHGVVQAPHEGKEIATGSPGARSMTSAPTASTMPAPSWPHTIG
jgi:hypothetical protein